MKFCDMVIFFVLNHSQYVSVRSQIPFSLTFSMIKKSYVWFLNIYTRYYEYTLLMECPFSLMIFCKGTIHKGCPHLGRGGSAERWHVWTGGGVSPIWTVSFHPFFHILYIHFSTLISLIDDPGHNSFFKKITTRVVNYCVSRLSFLDCVIIKLPFYLINASKFIAARVL